MASKTRIWALAALLVACLIGAVAAIVIAPVFLDNETVKSGIASRLAGTTGGTVTLSGAPSVSFSPYLAVSYRDVEIASPAPELKPIVEIDILRVKLGFWSALLGRPSIESIELVRPTFTVPLEQARADLNAPFSKPSRIVAILTSAGAGVISLVDGVVDFHALDPTESQIFTGINGLISIAKQGGAVSLSLDAVWNGQPVSTSVTLGNLNAIAADASTGTTDISATLQSTPLSLSLSGILERGSGISLTGDLTMETPSIRRSAEWLQLADADDLPGMNLKLRGAALWAGNAVRLSNVAVTSEDWSASGRIDASLRARQIVIDGTLDVDQLSLSGETAEYQDVLVSLAGQAAFALDLRLSTDSIEISGQEFSDFAGGIRVGNGESAIDVGRARFAAGLLSGQLRFAVDGKRMTQFSLTNGNMAELAQTLPVLPAALTGTFNLDLALEGPATGINPRIKQSGEFALEVFNGSFSGIDLSRILLNQPSAGIATSQAGAKTISSFASLRAKGRISGADVLIQSGDIENPRIVLSFTGRSSLDKGSLAVHGKASAVSGGTEGSPAPVKRFFLGGTVADPLIVPLSTPPSNAATEPN